MQTLEQPHTFMNLFLGQLDENCESIQQEIKKLQTEVTNYGMSDIKIMQLVEQTEMMEDFREMLRSEDINNCADKHAQPFIARMVYNHKTAGEVFIAKGKENVRRLNREYTRAR